MYTVSSMPNTHPARPDRIIIDRQDDGYTPLDVMSAIVMWIMDDPKLLEDFREFVETHSEMTGDFTADESIQHLALVNHFLMKIWMLDGHDVWVCSTESRVN